MSTAPEFSFDELAACAKRELGKRIGFYPKLVASQKMKQADADHEIALMGQIADDYTSAAEFDRDLTLLPNILPPAAKAPVDTGWINRSQLLPAENLARIIAWHNGIDDDTWPQAGGPMIMDARQFIGNPHIYTYWRYFSFPAPQAQS